MSQSHLTLDKSYHETDIFLQILLLSCVLILELTLPFPQSSRLQTFWSP